MLVRHFLKIKVKEILTHLNIFHKDFPACLVAFLKKKTKRNVSYIPKSKKTNILLYSQPTVPEFWSEEPTLKKKKKRNVSIIPKTKIKTNIHQTITTYTYNSRVQVVQVQELKEKMKRNVSVVPKTKNNSNPPQFTLTITVYRSEVQVQKLS